MIPSRMEQAKPNHNHKLFKRTQLIIVKFKTKDQLKVTLLRDKKLNKSWNYISFKSLIYLSVFYNIKKYIKYRGKQPRSYNQVLVITKYSLTTELWLSICYNRVRLNRISLFGFVIINVITNDQKVTIFV